MVPPCFEQNEIDSRLYFLILFFFSASVPIPSVEWRAVKVKGRGDYFPNLSVWLPVFVGNATKKLTKIPLAFGQLLARA